MEEQMKKFWENFGANLRHCRQRQGLTQEELGMQLGVTRNYICNLEKGKGNPTVKNIWKLARVLSVDMDELLSGVDDGRGIRD